MKKILILGVNGFIGHHLSKRIVAATDWEIYGMDMQTDRISSLLPEKRFHFFPDDITINREWIEYHIKKCDTAAMVAIATPATYVREPLRVFELDFEANLPIVRATVVTRSASCFHPIGGYGMSRDEVRPETSDLVLGPINKPRWIYSCAKQLMDRVVAPMACRASITLFDLQLDRRGLDSINTAKEAVRASSPFLGHIVRGEASSSSTAARRSARSRISTTTSTLLKIIANDGGIRRQDLQHRQSIATARSRTLLMLDWR